MHYYNEIDKFAAEWIRWLIKAKLIPDGTIDTRSIVDVRPEDLEGYVQCHFFAGVAGWPLALGIAGWPTDRPCWTGSCPCPPFSTAGRKKACPTCGATRPIPCPRRTGVFICIECEHSWYADGRHLFPEFDRLIAHCRPPVVLGEQVSGNDGLVWLAGVRARLERSGYAVGAADLPAACVGSPNIRQRIWWSGVRMEVAMRGGWRQGEKLNGQLGGEPSSAASGIGGLVNSGQLAPRSYGPGEGSRADQRLRGRPCEEGDDAGRLGGDRRLADSDGGVAGDGRAERGGEQRLQPDRGIAGSIGLEYADRAGRGEPCGTEPVRAEQFPSERAGRDGGVGDAGGNDMGRYPGVSPGAEAESERERIIGGDGGDGIGRSGSVRNPWSECDLVYCGDEKWRRIPRSLESGVQRVADGLPVDLDLLRAACETFPRSPKIAGRVGVLRGYGNAINPHVGAKFISMIDAWISSPKVQR